MDASAARQLPDGRHWFVDDQGVALRATWRLERGFVNLSMWEHDHCTATFHLTPSDAAQLMSFLARGLADATAVAAMATVRALPDPPAGAVASQPEPRPAMTDQLAATARATRSRLAKGLEAIAARVMPD